MIKAAAFDLDGTIYLGDQLLPGVTELLTLLKQKGITVKFFTNNSTKTRTNIIEKLNRLGVPARLDDLMTSAYGAALYVKEHNWQPVRIFGSPELFDEFRSMVIEEVNAGRKPKAVVVGLDPQFNDAKLAEIISLVSEPRPHLIACNLDMDYPVEGGKLLPGCGAQIARVEAALGRKVDVVIGKPNVYLLKKLAKGFCPDEILVVGDNLESDIKMADNYGARSFLVKPTGTNINEIAKLFS